MNKTEVQEHLSEVKLNLATKYEAASRRTNSRVRQRKLLNQADSYRAQAQDIARRKPR